MLTLDVLINIVISAFLGSLSFVVVFCCAAFSITPRQVIELDNHHGGHNYTQ